MSNQGDGHLPAPSAEEREVQGELQTAGREAPLGEQVRVVYEPMYISIHVYLSLYISL